MYLIFACIWCVCVSTKVDGRSLSVILFVETCPLEYRVKGFSQSSYPEVAVNPLCQCILSSRVAGGLKVLQACNMGLGDQKFGSVLGCLCFTH